MPVAPKQALPLFYLSLLYSVIEIYSTEKRTFILNFFVYQDSN